MCSKLVKVSKAEFNKTCKKQYMEHKQFELTLKADEGHDESMPISLIEYHNKIISELLQRTEVRWRVWEVVGSRHVPLDPLRGGTELPQAPVRVRYSSRVDQLEQGPTEPWTGLGLTAFRV